MGKENGKSSNSRLWALVVTIVPIVVTTITTVYLKQKSDAQLRAQLYSQLISHREEAEGTLRKDMLRSLIPDLIAPSKLSADSVSMNELDAMILPLELITYNFHESLQLGPLFLAVKRRVARVPDDSVRRTLDGRLEMLSQNVIRKQVETLARYGCVAEESIDMGKMRARLGVHEIVLQGVNAGLARDSLEDSSFVYGALPLYAASSHSLRETMGQVLEYADGAGWVNQEQYDFASEYISEIDTTRAFRGWFPLERKCLSVSDESGVYRVKLRVVITEVDWAERSLGVRVKKCDEWEPREKARWKWRGWFGSHSESEAATATDTTCLANMCIVSAPADTNNLSPDFHVGFYDFPLIDNTRLAHDFRFAVFLDRWDDERREIKIGIALFPGYVAGMREKPFYQDVLENLRHE